jgi:hypothetical protein
MPRMKKTEIPSSPALVASNDATFLLLPRLGPDALALVSSGVIALQVFQTDAVETKSLDWMGSVLGTELFTVLFVALLVEIASRRRAAPTLWMGLLIVAGLVAYCPQVLMLARSSWNQGLWVFVPFLWSMVERLRRLWTLPIAPPLEKLRTRALAFGRLQTAMSGFMVLFFLLLASLLVNHPDPDFPYRVSIHLLPCFLIFFFAVACIDTLRVHGESFARAPRRLWSKAPDRQLTQIDPI